MSKDMSKGNISIILALAAIGIGGYMLVTGELRSAKLFKITQSLFSIF
jgi:hypothetical protein